MASGKYINLKTRRAYGQSFLSKLDELREKYEDGYGRIVLPEGTLPGTPAQRLCGEDRRKIFVSTYGYALSASDIAGVLGIDKDWMDDLLRVIPDYYVKISGEKFFTLPQAKKIISSFFLSTNGKIFDIVKFSREVRDGFPKWNYKRDGRQWGLYSGPRGYTGSLFYNLWTGDA